MKYKYFLLIAPVFLSACTSLHESFSQITWQDQRGDRGNQVMQRDLAWCLELIETRRSLLEACMHERGWSLLPPSR